MTIQAKTNSLKTEKPQHPVEAFLNLLLRSDSCLICQRPVDWRFLLLSYRLSLIHI